MAKPVQKHHVSMRATSREWIYARVPARASKMADRCANTAATREFCICVKRQFYENPLVLNQPIAVPRQRVKKMAECRKVAVAVALLVLAARVVSCIQHCNRSEARKDLRSDAGFAPNDVLFAPELELSLSSAIALPSRAPSLPRRIDYCCPSEEKRPPPRAKIPDSAWYLRSTCVVR